jgi:PAS domain S-box-containing protein
MKNNKSVELNTAEQIKFMTGLIKQVSQPMIVTSTDRRLLHWNAAFTKLTGYNSKELSDPIISAGLTAPEWQESETKAFERLQRTGKSQIFQKEYIRKDGSRVPVELLVYQLSEGNGKIQYYIGLITDITERKQLQEALQKSENHYRILVDNAIEGIVVIQDGEIKFVNPIVAIAAGYSSEEMLSISLKELLYPDNEKAALESISQAVVPGTLLVVPLLKIRTKAGEIRLIESTIVSIVWDDKPANLNLLRDITEHKQAEAILSQSEEKYRSILEDIREGYWEVDLAGNFISYNDAICRILGYSEKEMVNTNYRAYTSPEDADKVYEAFNQVYRTGKPIRNMHYEIAHKDGSKRFAETSVFTKQNDEGKVVGFRGVSHDITERKKMEEALRRSEERYRTILEDIQENYFEIDLTGSFTFCNDSMRRSLGYSQEELIGMNYKVFTPPDQVKELFEIYNRMYRTGEPTALYQAEQIRKDGTRVSVEYSAVLIRNEIGEIIGFRGIGHDITERTQMEEALRRSEERYRTILEDMEETYFELDLAGNFTFFNNALCLYFGYSKEELTGMNYRAYVPPEDAKSVARAYNQVYSTGKPITLFSKQDIRKDGTRLNSEISIAPIRNEKGEIIGFRGVGRDMTKRVQTEKSLIQSEEKYRSILEHMEEAYSEVDLAGNFTFFNNALSQHLGYSREELLGMNYKVYTSSENVKKVFEAYNQVYRTGEPIKLFAIEETKKDRMQMVAEISVSPLRDEMGKIVGFRQVSRNITERMRMEEALRRSEERYRTIMDEMHDDYFENDLDGTYTFVNDAFCRSVGYTTEELIGKNYSITAHKDDIKGIFKAFNQIYRTGQPIKNLPHIFAHKDGSYGAGELSAFPMRNDKGEIVGFRGVSHDVTEHKQMEEALKRSEERYRTVLEDMEEAYYELDITGNYTFFNDALCRLLGYSKDELMGMNYKVYTMPEDINRVFEAFNQIYRTGGPLTAFPMERIKKDGTRIFTETSGFPLRNERGEITGFRGVIRDITQRKQAEEEYQTIIRIAMDGFWLTDMQGHFLEVNEAYSKLIGYSRDELLNMSISNIEKSEKPEDVAEHIQKIKEFGYDRFETGHRRKDGQIIDVDVSATYLPFHNGRLFVAIRDITEHKKAEEEKKQLEQKAQFASRLASVGELASGVAHEINNPLTGVIGYAHLLLARKDISRDVRHDLEIINEGSQRVAGIVKKLLAFARQTKPEQRYVNINELIRNTLDLRAYELAASNIKVTLQLARDMPMTIADPGQLQQVFLNLIINAETEMKLARDGGRLSIKTEKINSTFRITFKDSGPGIARENLETIFDPFFTTREVGQGTGLGLSVCHGIVTEHKGKIWAESEPGKGATFIIELPLVTEEVQFEPPEPVIEEAPRVAKARILVVDDEPVIRQFISQVLGEQGHAVETVDNAASALKMVKSKRYRLILLDIKMPGMSGVELYKKFQKIAPSLTKRVVFITGDVMGKRTLAFLDKTKTPYMMKPFDARELKTQINRILARK